MDAPLAERILETFDSLSPQLQAAARFVIDHPRDVALLSMREQARRAGLPPATMTRLAKQLGQSGYDEIRAAYASALRSGFAPEAGRQWLAQSLHGDAGLASDMLRAGTRQIEGLDCESTIGQIVEAAAFLSAARRIYCLGLRGSYPVAWCFHYVMSLAGERSVLLEGSGGLGADALARAVDGDALFVVSIRPYTRRSLDLTDHAASRGLGVVALTDSRASPLTRIATRAVIVPTDSPSFFHLVTPAFLVAETLAALVTGRSGHEAVNALRRADAHLAALDTHLTSRQNRPKRPT